jgi:hypothetical protein
LAKEAWNDLVEPSKFYIQLFIERAQEVNPSMNFLNTSKKRAFQKFYAKNPIVMPNKEIKTFKV